MTRRLACLGLLIAMSGSGHRLDEYLQGILVSVDHGRLEAEVDLTPGVAVLPQVLAAIDVGGRDAYAASVLRDLTITIDGRTLSPNLNSVTFPKDSEMKEGRGTIRVRLVAGLPGSGHHTLSIDNRHLSGISVYQVNALAPGDPNVQIVAQRRNENQSHYELEFVQSGRPWVPAVAVAAVVIAALVLAKRRGMLPG